MQNLSKMRWEHELTGNPEGPTLVCLHGFLGSSSTWADLVAAHGHAARLVLFSLPGHGQPATPLPDTPLSFDVLSTQLEANLDGMGITECVLLGYSLGGRVAMNFALSHPRRLSALILESASPGLDTEADRAARLETDDRLAAGLGTLSMSAFAREWYDQPLFASLNSKPALKMDLIERAGRNSSEAMARVLSELSPGRMDNLWPRLPELALRVLLVAGELDSKYAALVRRAATAIPGAKTEIISGAGHNTHAENPAAFSAAVARFLDGLG